jgi:hypothetical protein
MVTLTLMTLFYFLPTLIASQRGHGVGGVLVLNIFFGWTGIGWIALMLWALLSQPRVYFVATPFAGSPVYQRYGGWRRY